MSSRDDLAPSLGGRHAEPEPEPEPEQAKATPEEEQVAAAFDAIARDLGHFMGAAALLIEETLANTLAVFEDLAAVVETAFEDSPTPPDPGESDAEVPHPPQGPA